MRIFIINNKIIHDTYFIKIMDYLSRIQKSTVWNFAFYNKSHLLQTQVCEPELILWAVLTLATFICYLSVWHTEFQNEFGHELYLSIFFPTTSLHVFVTRILYIFNVLYTCHVLANVTSISS